jgi:hypothetical protein
MNGIWSEFAEEGLNETDNMITAPAVDVDDINLNGINGVDGIIDMIKDTIDSGDTEGAKDWLNQLQQHFNEVL